jgi:hypothetical protein
MLGLSPMPNQTQNGPITISNSITKLTIAEVVYRGAILRNANEIGSITIPIENNVQIGALKILSSALK